MTTTKGFTADDFEPVTVPGAGWTKFPEPGTSYVLQFVSYDPTGGHDFDGNPCPEYLMIDTTDGEFIRLTADKNTIRDGMAACSLRPNDVVKITRAEDGESKTGRTYHKYEFAVARGKGQPVEDESDF